MINIFVIINWVHVFKGVIAFENNAPLKLYNGLPAFLCFNLRPKFGGQHEPLEPDAIVAMKKFMAERQENRAVTSCIKSEYFYP